MFDTVIIFSGGMDSTVLLADLIEKGQRISAVSFNYGSKHNHKELAMAQAITMQMNIEHRIIALPFINELFDSTLLRSGGDVPDGSYDAPGMKATVVPFRNGIMLAIAAGYAESIGAREVALGSHSGDHYIYPDCRPEFNQAISRAAWLGTGEKVTLRFPFAHMDKRDIGDLGRKLGVDFNQTWTCYKGGRLHCGTCGACRERKYALRHDEHKDGTNYER